MCDVRSDWLSHGWGAAQVSAGSRPCTPEWRGGVAETRSFTSHIKHQTSQILLLLCVLCGLSVESFAGRVFETGFEENDFITTMWTVIESPGSPTIQTTTKRSGTYAMRTNQTTGIITHVRRSFSAADTAGTYSAEFCFYIVDLPDTLPVSIWIWGNGNSSVNGSGPVHIKLITGPKLRITNTLTATDTDGTTTLSLNTWYCTSQKVVLGDSPNGSIELRLNGAVEATHSSTDTLDGANGISRIYLGAGSLNDTAPANFDIFFDDVRVNDETGTFQTDYPTVGSKIAGIFPSSDNTVTWTRNGAGCTGTSNADCVNDVPGTPDDATTYNNHTSASQVDRLNDTSLPAEVTSDADIILVDVWARFGGTGTTGSRQCRVTFWDQAGSQTNGPTTERCDVASGTFQLMRIGPTKDNLVFDAGTRTKADIDDADSDIGYENVSAHDNRLTALWGNVEWIEAPAAPAVMPRRMVAWE